MDVDGFVQDAQQRNCLDAFEKHLKEIKTVTFIALVVHKSTNFVFNFVMKYITLCEILLFSSCYFPEMG